MTAEQLTHKAKTHLAAALDLLQQGLIPGADGQMRSALRTLDELWPTCQKCGHKTWLADMGVDGVCQCCYFAEMQRITRQNLKDSLVTRIDLDAALAERRLREHPEECEVCHGEGLEALRDLMNRHTYPDACECGACERAREVLRRVDGEQS